MRWVTDRETAPTAGRRALLALALALALAACGKKGPLRLPEPAPASTPPAAPDAGAADDEAK